MRYQNSDLDKKNLEWFKRDNRHHTLVALDIDKGEIRGLSNLEISFTYPITAIAGRNGSGKTTVLALVSCAFHNSEYSGYRLPDRTKSYYTFSDFFIQSADEVPLSGINIGYRCLTELVLSDERKPVVYSYGMYKYRGGRWSRYSDRPYRTVVFLGIGRVVPDSEKSVTKGHRRSFRKAEKK